MERPIVTYQISDGAPGETIIDISIDRPINGFFGARMPVPTPTGTKAEKAEKIMEWVTNKVRQQLGQTADGVTIQPS